jgi:magnesium chelatase subunit I
VTAFDLGAQAETGSEKPASEYPALLETIDGLSDPVKRLTDDQRPEVLASAIEFVLEGLHLNRRLNCERSDRGYIYKR